MTIDNAGWKIVTIDELKANSNSAVSIGPFGSRMKSDCYTKVGVPVIRGNNISDTKVLTKDFVFISEEKANELRSSNVFADDLIFPHRGAIGKVGIVPRDSNKRFILSSSLMKLTCNRAIVEPLFLFYFFRSPTGRYELLKNSSTVGTPGIATPLTTLKSLKVPLPPLPEQRAIAHILGSLDDKIELNRQMNATLEAIARALFQSWFVDFDPVHAKANGQPPVGIDAETAALFPDAFEETEIGLVPKGWKIGTLAEYAELNPESWSRGTAPTEILYVDLANTKWGRIEEMQRFIWKDAPSRAQRILRPGDTIVGTVRPGNGSFALISEEGLTGSTGFAVLRPRKTLYEEYIYLATTSPDNIEQLSHLADGGAYPAVRPDVVLATQTVQSSESLLEFFSNIVKPLMLRIAANQRESRTLAELRDTLLPKLMSGQLRVPEAAEITEALP